MTPAWVQFLEVFLCSDCEISQSGEERWEKFDFDGELLSMGVDPCTTHHRMFIDNGWKLVLQPQEDNELSSLDGLFRYADIDEVTDDHDGSAVYISFTLRNSRRRFSVEGKDLPDALAIAEEITRRDRTLEELRREGLTDEDIDRLSVDVPELLDEAWQRGYAAAMQDSEREDELLAHEAYLQNVTTASPAPVMAMAGQPMTAITGPLSEAQIERLNIDIANSNADIESDMSRPVDSVGIPVIISVPAKIVIS